jgi:hypothetical protein
MTTLAGCSSVSGPSGEVIKNEFTNVEVSDLQIENTEVLGTKAVQAKFVLENTGTEETVVHVKTEFYNDDVLVGTDGASYLIVLLFHQEIGSKKLKVSRDALKISRLTK